MELEVVEIRLVPPPAKRVLPPQRCARNGMTGLSGWMLRFVPSRLCSLCVPRGSRSPMLSRSRAIRYGLRL